MYDLSWHCTRHWQPTMPHSIALRPSIPSLLCFDHPNMVSGVVSASQGHCISFVMHLQVLDNGSTCREMLTWLSTWEAQDAISANRNPSSCYHKEVLHECEPDQDWVQNVRICCHVQLVLGKPCCKMQSTKKMCSMMQGIDSDDSTVSDNEQRQGAMLLIGPVGSGKTSLVYTAAQVTKKLTTSCFTPVAHPPCAGTARITCSRS